KSSINSTRHRSRLSAGSPFPSSGMRSRSSQVQNHSAEPGKYQQQSHRGRPARGGVDQQLRQGKRKIGHREQGGPCVGMASAAPEAVERGQQGQRGESG